MGKDFREEKQGKKSKKHLPEKEVKRTGVFATLEKLKKAEELAELIIANC